MSSELIDGARFEGRPILSTPDLGFSAYGVNLSTGGEDGDWIALGHVRPLLMLAAMRKVNRDHMGCTDEEIFGDADWGPQTERVAHLSALFTDTDDGWFANWGPEAREHPSAIDVTFWRS